ncbi:hypothetical protein BDZ90DRAFT_232549 [Jaminaea rosea]|uniref:Uncharacterized protein n=1 Tax=Jaminaea rosea TaxID=1569628 RepID=A0A316UNV3_9BASI|nr:hypothetical protein BDZ90DRAFT_232549 [Jaminaea rosea]PWN26967.1 hypothetical protein BDZ90DRAFT_232549 [Jaminaea rosea]
MRPLILLLFSFCLAQARHHLLSTRATVLLGRCTSSPVSICPLDYPSSWRSIPGNPRKTTLLNDVDGGCKEFKSAFEARDLKLCTCASCDCGEEQCKSVPFKGCATAPEGGEWKAICPVSGRGRGRGRMASDSLTADDRDVACRQLEG